MRSIKYRQTGTPGWTVEDTNCDGIINIIDVVTVAINYGRSIHA